MKHVFSVVLALLVFMASCTAAVADSESFSFTLSFNFDVRSLEDISMIDSALSSMRLSNVDITDENGYSSVRTVTNNGVSTTTYGYGFDNIILHCEKDGDSLYVWHIAVEAHPKSIYKSSDDFLDTWENNHPGTTVRTRIMISFDDLNAFVVLYHENEAVHP